MPGNPIDDIAVTARLDFVMHSGTVHCRPGDDVMTDCVDRVNLC
jgi:hypothetical protein